MMSWMFSGTISNSRLFSICKEIDAIDDNDTSVVFEPQYHGGSTMLKLYDTDLYVGCDRNGHTTLMKSFYHTNPSPKILFLAERVR